jgi:hypothetical protein
MDRDPSAWHPGDICHISVIFRETAANEARYKMCSGVDLSRLELTWTYQVEPSWVKSASKSTFEVVTRLFGQLPTLVPPFPYFFLHGLQHSWYPSAFSSTRGSGEQEHNSGIEIVPGRIGDNPRGFENAKIRTYLPFFFSEPSGTPPSLNDSVRTSQYGNCQFFSPWNECQDRHSCRRVFWMIHVEYSALSLSCSTYFDWK